MRVRRLRGFEEEGIAAIQASPGYFLRWYSLKSLALVAVTAALAYHLGRSSK